MSRADTGPKRPLIGGSLRHVGGVRNRRRYGNTANHSCECQSASRSRLLRECVRHGEGHLERCEDPIWEDEPEGKGGREGRIVFLCSCFHCVLLFLLAVLSVMRNKACWGGEYTVRMLILSFSFSGSVVYLVADCQGRRRF